jgi:hypothetical protein
MFELQANSIFKKIEVMQINTIKNQRIFDKSETL